MTPVKSLFLAAAVWTVAAPAAADCPPFTPERMAPFVKAAGAGGRVQLHFFATWCSDCQARLASPLPAGTVLIAFHDEPARAERALTQLGQAAPCLADPEGRLGAELGVNSVPTTVTYPVP